jgi:hypothetical protein
VKDVKGIKVKRAAKVFALVAVLGIGCFASYLIGYEAGRSHGWASGYEQGKMINAVPEPVKHHYELKQHDASIFRFDSDTGEFCWIQLSKGDAAGGPSMPHCSE